MATDIRDTGQKVLGAMAGMLSGSRGAAQPFGPDFPLLLAGAAVSSMGMAFLWPLMALYLHHGLGQPMTVVGVVMMAQAGMSAVGSLIGGVMYDARGARVPMLWSIGLSAVTLIVMAVFPGFWTFTVGVMIVGFCMSASNPIFNALSVDIWPAGGRTAFNAVYVAINAGVAIGSSLGGLLASLSFRVTFGIAGLVTAGIWILIYLAYRGDHWTRAPHRKPSPANRALGRTLILRAVGWPIFVLAGALALQWLAYDQWETTVPNFMQAEGLPLILYSSLWTLNTLLILGAQPLLAKALLLMPRVRTQLICGTVLFVAAFGTLTLFHTYPAYLIGMVLATLGEMLVLPGAPAAAEQWSDPSRRGLVQGVVATAGSLGRMAGPLLGGMLFSTADPRILFAVMTGMMAMGGVGYVAGGWFGAPSTHAAEVSTL
ncbi:MFS transporter [Sulfobacillus harzensis]|uniref:MFS transporter n=1 Tax=Sulfobacillus harzensis TaxID=2729629 RepID=A0A7Y0L564_9FIRM|nr:MFS transporter [Sulfobacillus harzensis]NMP23519.1 MFS transporter [Sulfobacillus harzensis]